MTIARRFVWLPILALLGGVGGASAQPPRDPAAAKAVDPGISALANGWSALAAGRRDEARKIADTLLARRPGDHRAIDLKIESLAQQEPMPALDAYEVWLTRTRAEDVFLLVPIARGVLGLIGAGPDQVLALQAWQRLARSGDPNDAARLEAFAQTSKIGAPQSDLLLALEGDAAAAERLGAPNAAPSVQPQTLARALGAGGAKVSPALRSLLKHSAAPVRMEAALSLGRSGAADAIPDLKALMNDPEVRPYAAVALVRLGENDGQAVVQEMLQSPVLDIRVLAAQAYAEQGSGPWVQALMPALQDPNGLTRIRAAELLLPVAPESAMPVLLEAAKDPNPVVRADVTRVLDRSAAERSQADSTGAQTRAGTATLGLDALRRLLRDPDGAARLHAASAILAAAHWGR